MKLHDSRTKPLRCRCGFHPTFSSYMEQSYTTITEQNSIPCTVQPEIQYRAELKMVPSFGASRQSVTQQGEKILPTYGPPFSPAQ